MDYSKLLKLDYYNKLDYSKLDYSTLNKITYFYFIFFSGETIENTT